ncbi:MAG: beta strand repeat-containing protein, partial [Chloroflexota bacterium]
MTTQAAPLNAPEPVVTLDLPVETMLGETFTFTATFENQDLDGLNDEGYGPFIDLYFPNNGADGAGNTSPPLDGLSFISADYLSTPIDSTVLTFPAGPLGGTCPAGLSPVEHPFAVDTSYQPLTVCGVPGDTLVVLRLPFGSFAVDQPPVEVTVNAQLSPLADLGTPLRIAARGGFEFGADPLDNPCCDPSDVAPTSSNPATWPGSTTEPVLVTLDKTNDALEGETATGPNYPRQYTITLDVADGQTLTDFDLTDYLPPQAVYLGIASSTPAATVIDAPPLGVPSNPPDNVLTVNFASITGTAADADATLVVDFYIAQADAGGGAVVPPVSGAPDTVDNRAAGQGDWVPLDPRDPGGTDNVGLNLTCPSCPPLDSLEARSIAVQKTQTLAVDNTSAGLNAGDVIAYTIDFQISDFFAFDSIVITDIFSDGQEFDETFTPTLTLNRHGSTLAAVPFDGFVGADPFSGGGTNFSYDRDTPGTGRTTVIFNVSDELVTQGFNATGVLVGGCVPLAGTGGAPVDCATFDAGTPTTGTITFRTRVRQEFTDTAPSGDFSVDHGDELSNDLTITGRVLDTDDAATPTGGSPTDDTGSSTIIAQGGVSKTLYAINGSTTLPTPLEVSPGDVVTWRLTYDMPSSDFEDFRLTDFLPLPVFDATEVAPPFDTTISAAAPPGGTASFGPAETLFPIAGITPTITTDPDANSVDFFVGTFDSDGNEDTTIDILFSVTVTDEPFADNLLLTNQVRGSEGSTNASGSSDDALAQIRVRQPILLIKKGLVGSTNPDELYTPDPPTPVPFNPPGTPGAPFTDTINSTNSGDDDLNSDLANVDASDFVRFSITVQNTGGAAAYDINVRDVVPPGFIIPANLADFYFDIRLGNGDPLTFTSNGAFGVNDPRNLFTANGIEIVDPAGDGACQPASPAAGTDIIIITYDLQIDNTVSAGDVLINTASVTSYAGDEGGPSHIDPGDIDTLFSDDASVSIFGEPDKVLVSTSEAGTTGTDVTIGERVRYQLAFEIPEGTTNGFAMRDDLPAGMTYLPGTARFAIISNGGVTSDDPDINAVGAAFINGSTLQSPPDTAVFPAANVSGGTGDGVAVTFNFGNVLNSDSDPNDEFIVVEFDALVLNVPDNQDGTALENTFTVVVDGTDREISQPLTVDVVEPGVTVDKTAAPTSGVDAGDTVTFTVVVTADGSSPAYDVVVTDTPPFVYDNFTVTGITQSGTVGAITDNSTATALDVAIASMTPGSTVTITYTVDLTVDVNAGEDVVNTAEATFTSLPGDQGTTPTPGASGDDDGERNGTSAPDTLNDYASSDDATVTIAGLEAEKSIVTTSEASTPGTEVTVGEILRYQLAVTLPEGTTPSVTLFDQFSPGVQFIDDGTATVEFINDNAFTVPGDLDGANTGEIALPGGRISTAGDPYDAGNPQSVTFSLGSIVNNDVNDGDVEQVIVRFNVLVVNGAVTNLGDVLANDFVVRVNGVDAVTSNTVDATVVEPVLAADKTINTALSSPAPYDAGDTVVYDVVVSNTGSADAFDITVIDTLVAELNFVAGPTAVQVFDSGGTLLTPGVDYIDNSTYTDPGEQANVVLPALVDGGTANSFTVRLTTVVLGTVTPGEVITNQVDVTYSSLPGDQGTPTNPTGSSTPGASGDDDGERNGTSTPDTVNDYSASGSVDTTIAGLEAEKSIVTTSEASTPGTEVT